MFDFIKNKSLKRGKENHHAIIAVKKMTGTAKLPTRGSEYAAGYDLYADTNEIIDIAPHSTVMISTGIAMSLPEQTFGAIYPRSGIASKRGLRLGNCVGVIDSDYRGVIYIPMHNDTDEMQSIEPHERIAQIIVQEYIPANFVEAVVLDDTKRGDGGFGSSGRK